MEDSTNSIAMTSSSSINSLGKVKMVKCIPTFMWTIKNFCICHNKTSDPLKSPIFSMGSNDEMKWSIHLYPKGFDKTYSDYVSLFLQLEEYDHGSIKVKYKFSILNHKNVKTNEMGSDSDRSFDPGCDWGFREFISRDYLFDEKNGLLPNNKLTIFVEIDINNKHNNNVLNRHMPTLLCGNQSRVLDDLDSLLKDRKLCDVTLLVGDRKFYAHKAILTARSPIFSSMFEHDMEENQTNVVEIVDLDEEVIKDMLQYIYTGKVEELHKVARDLLPAADKYYLEGLKMICEESISRSLTVDNAAEILALSDHHNTLNLKKETLNFIIDNGQDVANTDGFKTLTTTRPHLIAEAFQTMVTKLNPPEIIPQSKRKKHSDSKEK